MRATGRTRRRCPTARGYDETPKHLDELRRLDLLLIDTGARDGEPAGSALVRVAVSRLVTRVIYMTGTDAERDVEAARGPILVKPFDADTLRETVQSSLRPA